MIDRTLIGVLNESMRNGIETMLRDFTRLSGFAMTAKEVVVMTTPKGDLSVSFKLSMPEPVPAHDVTMHVNFGADCVFRPPTKAEVLSGENFVLDQSQIGDVTMD